MTRATRHRRGGVSLMEVLIAIFVIMVGLLGLLALIPVGGLAIQDMVKADRTGTLGRAALRDVKVRRMLDPELWIPKPDPKDPNPAPFAIDPLGVVVYGLGEIKLGGVLDRRNLALPPEPTPLTAEQATWIFLGRDDRVFTIPKDPAERKKPTLDDNGEEKFSGHYSWFLTVSPAMSEKDLWVRFKSQYMVSVVVCYKRQFTEEGERTVKVTEFLGGGWGGGSIVLDEQVNVREDQWIMLYDASQSGDVSQCKWYRVVAVGKGDLPYLTLSGPDWDVMNYPKPTAVIISTVVGVYTEPIELDRDPAWLPKP